MAEVRVLQTTKVTMTHTFVVDETPTDAAGDVTWITKRLDGTTVDSGTADHPGPDGKYTLPLQAAAAPDAWTLDWTGTFGGAPVTVRDIVDIVGGYMFGIAEARSAHMTLRNTNLFPTAKLVDQRTRVEMEAEGIAGRAFVPRFTRVALAGNGTCEIAAPHLPIRAVRAVSVWGTPFTEDQLANVYAGDAGVLYYPGGWAHGRGSRNIVVEYEYGLDSPPFYVRDAGITRLRQLLSENTSAIPSNATSWTTQDGGVFRLTTAGVRSTGYADIDAAYLRDGYDGPV